MKKFIRFAYPPIIWALIIFSFSAQPTGTTSSVQWQDFSIKKFAHVAEYAVFVVLIYRALFNYQYPKRKALLYSFAIAVLYAVTDEFHQIFTPTREPHIRDVIFDTIGASISILILWKFLARAPTILKKLAEDFQLI